MKTNTLIIMAAGFGSRYKGGTKQTTGVGPSSEWIMDYSIYDAYQAGIRKVVIIIREELTDFMKEHFESRLPADLELQFVYQDVRMIPDGFDFPERIKPWGTGHAILCCKDIVKEPFIVVNADDYYGSEIFHKTNRFLEEEQNFCMAGFFLKNTLSENGGVNRGICQVDSNMNLVEIKETFQIEQKENEAVGTLSSGEIVHMDLDSYCSLNLWGFMPTIFETLESQFQQFLSGLKDNQEEFLLPNIVQNLVSQNKVTVKVLTTDDEWFGMTYQEDRVLVEHKIAFYCEKGKYPVPLWK